MEAFNSNIIERRQPPRRNDSFSTVNSSVAADLMQQFTNTNSDAGISQILGDGIPSNNQTSMKFERSEGVHVGDIIYNYYTPPVVATNKVKSQKNTDKDSLNSHAFKNFTKMKRKYFQGENRKRNIWITTVTLSAIIILSIIIGVIIYFVFVKKNEPVKTTTTTIQPITNSTYTNTETTTTAAQFNNNLIKRDDWNASKPTSSLFPSLTLPIKRIIIAHTRGIHCDSKIDCRSLVKNLQTQAFESNLNDIAYNFLIGNDGFIYEGRGFQIQGEHTEDIHASEYNSIGICIAFVGNYLNFSPSSNQLDVLKNFIEYFVKNGTIDANYTVVAQDDLINTSIKADALVETMKSFDNFHKLQKIYRRNEWNARSPTGITKYDRTMNWIMLTHTVTSLCSSLTSCISMMQSLQNSAMNIRNWSDIFVNFLIGGDGLIFEGRGWDNVAAHTTGYNSRTIGVALVGNFDVQEPNQLMLTAMQKLFDDGVLIGKLTNDYIINGRSDFREAGPGEGVMKYVREWCRYGNRTRSC